MRKCFCLSCLVLAIFVCSFTPGCQTPQITTPQGRQSPPQAEQIREKAVMEKKFEILSMEKKFEILRKNMTKADVDEILGEPTGCMLGGGSLSMCDQYYYTWRGEDGSIFVTFAKNLRDEHPNWGPPGKQNRILMMNYEPNTKKAN